MKRALALLVMVSLLAVLFAGCSGGGSTTATTAAATTAAEATTAAGATTAPADTGSKIFAEPTVVSVLSPSSTAINISNEIPVLGRIEEITNVVLDWQLLPATEAATKFQLLVQSDDLPELIGYGTISDRNTLGMDGILAPLKSLMYEYGPLIVAAYDDPIAGEKIPYSINAWGEGTAPDGEIYTILAFSASNAIGAIPAIRNDWLKNVNMEMPTNAEEFYSVMKAFKEQDANGNGDATDEVPIVSGQGGGYSRLLPLITAFDAHANYYIDENDTYQYGRIEDSFREGLAYLHKMYEEGLIQSDYLTATNDQYKEIAYNNRAGWAFMWPGSGLGATNNAIQQLDPSYEMVPMAPLVSSTGKQYKDTNTSGNAIIGRTSINAKAENKDKLMQYLNWYFTDEATLLCGYGIEGDTYNMVNGEPVYTEKILNNPDGVDPENARLYAGCYWQAFPYNAGWAPHFQALGTSQKYTVMAWETYREPGMVEAPLPSLNFSADDRETYNANNTEINTYAEAMINKFIMGEESLDNFDDFVAKIKALGIEKNLEICNKAYSEYKAKLG
ncbi:MAG: extracellular solute-binding protein [Eubacteriales bacterium]